MPRNIHARLLD